MLVQTLITDYFHVKMDNKKNKVQSLITYYYEKKRKFTYDNNLCEMNCLNKTYEKNETNKKNKKEKIYGFNPETESWHCLQCGVDMGIQNPRQLCGKYFCHNEC